MEILERSILAEFLLLPTYKEQVDAMLELNDGLFTDSKAKILLHAFSQILFEKRCHLDIISVYQSILKIDTISAMDLAELNSEPFFAERITEHIKQLKEKHYRTEIINRSEKILGEMKTTLSITELDTKKDEMIVSLSAIDMETESNFINPQPIIELIEENLSKEKDLEGHSWGLVDLNAYTSGIVTPRLYVLGGLKKSGKSRFVINTMIELYHDNIPSVFLSLEMPEYEVVKLILARYAGIPEPRLRSASILSHDERIKFQQTKKDIDWDLLNIECASRLNKSQIIGRIRKYKRQFKNPVIFIDYLQRISHDRNRQAFELEDISNMIADATREYDAPIILLSQLSNLAEREGASIGALKGSGGIGEAADSIFLLDNLYRKEKTEMNKGKMDMYIEQRYGDSGKIKITCDLSFCKFADMIPDRVSGIDRYQPTKIPAQFNDDNEEKFPI